MAISYEFRIKNIDEAKEAFSGMEEKFKSNIKNALDKSINVVWGTATKITPVDTGHLRGKLRKKVYNDRAVIGTNVKYAIYVHEGTRPHWPPIEAITPWAKRHGIEPFLVARSIAKHGTRAQPFIKEAINNSQNKIEGFFEQAVNKTLDSVVDKINK